MSGARCSPDHPQRGFVIVVVLWMLLALSSLAMIFALYLSASARAMALGDTALQNEALVSAGIELTAYQLILAGDDARPARGSFHFRMDDANVGVTFTSEAARIDLNLASKEVLAAFLAGLGASKDAANEDAERIVGWRTPPTPGSTNDEAARYAALGYSPRQSLFTHVNELALVAGLPLALVDRALPFVTIFNGSADVDATIAAPEVVAAFAKRSNANTDPFGSAMGPSNDPLAGADPSAPTKSNLPRAKSPCYRVETTVGFANGRRATSEVVIALGDKREPYRVLSWQDDVVPTHTPLERRGS
ncbi:general secretion pathway protein GspK [Bradyrhizobium sp. ISRA443]|uniref:general secretion pathway protein GspK n=1 Tax=unclassified Bradyrhizobium TaxID=2631580 RepID=UPI002479DAAA|nr:MULTISPECIES: type II secretion system protein GspK [unclassified Bradyrhizobium]WGR97079.1 general secretion pathway protein GspK [Bradyrhizobium sp. ISRA436]WGS03967.1 general secretion pathway protein GspK [Bradyrhizobium sp. ISRA437]WGS10850.1 general secretion pathway protein GspK [Bradyrhizobium sp. ISRA443]